MESDRSDDPDIPPMGADRPDDHGGDDGRATRPGATRAENRDHQECYVALRMAVPLTL